MFLPSCCQDFSSKNLQSDKIEKRTSFISNLGWQRIFNIKQFKHQHFDMRLHLRSSWATQWVQQSSLFSRLQLSLLPELLPPLVQAAWYEKTKISSSNIPIDVVQAGVLWLWAVWSPTWHPGGCWAWPAAPQRPQELESPRAWSRSWWRGWGWQGGGGRRNWGETH